MSAIFYSAEFDLLLGVLISMIYVSTFLSRVFTFQHIREFGLCYGLYLGYCPKWTILGQSEQFEGVKLDGLKVRKWTVIYETGRSERD